MRSNNSYTENKMEDGKLQINYFHSLIRATKKFNK